MQKDQTRHSKQHKYYSETLISASQSYSVEWYTLKYQIFGKLTISFDQNLKIASPSRLRWRYILSKTSDHFNLYPLRLLQIRGLDHSVTKQAVKSARIDENSPKEVQRITDNGYQNLESQPICDTGTPSKSRKTETKK